MRNYKTIDTLSWDECNQLLKDESISDDTHKEIEARLDELRKEAEIDEKNSFDNCTTVNDYQEFLKKYPKSGYSSKAEAAIDDITFNKLRKTKSGCKKYLSQYPDGVHVSEAKERIRRTNRNWKIVIAFFVAIVIVLLIGYRPAPSFELAKSCLYFEKEGGVQCVTFNTEAMSSEYEYSVGDSWLEVYMEDNNKFRISVLKNTDKKRWVYVKIITYSKLYGVKIFSSTTWLEVSQKTGQASYINISSEDVSFTETGGGRTINVSSDGYWTVSSNYGSSWCHITQYDNCIKITADYNDNEDREASFSVTSGSVSKIIKVKQCAKPASYLSLSRDEITIDVDGTSEGKCMTSYYDTDGKMVDAFTDGSDWLSVSVNKSQERVQIEAGPNEGGRRYAYVYVKVNGCKSRIYVMQKAKTRSIGLEYSWYKFDTKTDYTLFDISCDGDEEITASTYSSWITCSITSSKRLKVSVHSNSGSRRDGKVYVKSGNMETSIVIRQNGWQNCCYCNQGGYVWGITGYDYYGFPIYGWVLCNHCGGSHKIKSTW